MQVTNQQEAALFVYGSFEHLKGWPFKKSVVYIARDGHVYLDMDEAVAAVGNEIVVLPESSMPTSCATTAWISTIPKSTACSSTMSAP